MAQAPLGRSNVKYVPLPVQLVRSADFKFNGRPPIRDVPYVPTPDHVVARMLQLADVNENDVVYDLGCGDGRILVTAAKERGARGVGIDIDPNRIKDSKANAIKFGVSDRVKFEEGSAFKAEISEATVVALYLLPWMNTQLRPKLLTELKPGTRVVAHQFAIAEWPADKTLRIEGQDRVIYLWIVPANVNGTWNCTIRTPDGVLRRGTIEWEQEFQTVVGKAMLDGAEWDIDSATLRGSCIDFTIKDVTYRASVDGKAFRGAGHREGKRGQLEVRARKA